MRVNNFLSNIDYSIQNDETIRSGLDKMNDLHATFLILLQEDNYIGLLSEADLLEAIDDQAPLSSVRMNTIPVQLKYNQHPYDALVAMNVYQIAVIPILDEENSYIGSISYAEVIQAISLIQSQNESGAILVFEMGLHDFSLTQVAHLVESDNCRILNCATCVNAENATIEVTIKVDKSNITSLVHTLSRHNYTVLEIHNQVDGFDDTSDRYQHLMNYLNI